jgi:hypothetical protein
MKKTNQSGFTPVAILLVLILVTIVGFAGYYVYKTQQNKKDDTKPTAADPASTPTAPSTTNTQKYLVIKEWGVKVPLTTPIADATYLYKAFDGGGSSVYLSTKSIASKYPECAANKTTLFAYGRFDNPNALNDFGNQSIGADYPNAPKVGTYYYYGVHPQAPCFYNASVETSNTIQTTEIDPVMAAFKDALSKVQAE